MDDMLPEGDMPTPAVVTVPTARSEARSGSHKFWIAGGITVGALLLLALKLWLQSLDPALKLDDALSVGLLVVAVLPWLSQLLISARLPGGWELVFREIQETQAKQGDQLFHQQEQIRALRTAVRGIVTTYELDKLVGLNREGPFLCNYSDDMYEELKHLRALNLVRHHEGTGLAKMRGDYKNKNVTFDLKHFFFITEEGRDYLQIRSETEKPEP
jgi:hypothetical protein